MRDSVGALLFDRWRASWASLGNAALWATPFDLSSVRRPALLL
jgi:hypothetical protein